VKLLKKTFVLLFAFLLLFSTNIMGINTFAAQISSPKVTIIQNDFIKVTVNNSTGRFGIRTVDGQPIRKKDQNVNMLFGGDDPETSFTTFKIDGTDYIFGNPYKFGASFFSEITAPKVINYPDGSKHIETIWTIKDVQIRQVIKLHANTADVKDAGNVSIRYDVLNKSKAKVELGTRVLLDTMVASNDGPEFQIGTAYRAPLTVERKLVHNPEELNIPEEDQAFYKLPAYWVMRDTLDLTNPLATNAVAYGFNNFSENNINIVDEMIVGHWNNLSNTKWAYEPNPNLDFTRDTNDYGTADSAVALYWNPDSIKAGDSHSFETVYGLGELIQPDKVFSIRYIDPVQQLATKADNSEYENDGIFDITAEIENLSAFDMEHSYIDLNMTLQNGLSFVKVDEAGKIVRDGNGKAITETYRTKELRFRKTATPKEAEQGIQPKYKPGETVTVSFKVQAKGKPWPTTREYMLTAKSPETTEKIDGIEDESIKAQYESSETNFVLLPAIGEAMPTYVYGMSPNELYMSDIKYITLHLSNIEAYNPGNENVAANFDLYLKEKITGKRYKVSVSDSVLLQPTDDGLTGDMRITYRDGDLVDKNGVILEANLGPDLPMGEYQVEIDYTGNMGGDEELAAIFDITTEQTFLVTDNEETRIREANILAVYKQVVDLTNINLIGGNEDERLEIINSAFPTERYRTKAELAADVIKFKNSKMTIGTKSKAVDSSFDLAEFLDDGALEEVPLYHYRTFDSEEDLEEFFDDEEAGRELLLDIRGMIKQVGTGVDQQIVIDTKTEPAVINGAVSYKGKDLVFVRGHLNIFGEHDVPFLETLFVKGDGVLNVANSGFVFHQGEWTIDFFNGFDKGLSDVPDGEGDEEQFRIFPESEEDDSLNGSLKWAVGNITDRVSPIRQVMLDYVYFNQHSLFATPSFTISGFTFSFNDYILRNGGISFGGAISMKIVEAEIQNVVFNNKGFVGVDTSLKFELDAGLGLFSPSEGEDGIGASGGIDITHYVQDVGKTNRYGLNFEADLLSQFQIQAELAFKQVADGRILPDTIAFGLTLPPPGVPVVPGVIDVSGLRGAIRELADTIAGGTSKDPFPLVLQAGVTARVGAPGVYFYGDIDLTVKRTGLALMGKLDLSMDGGENLIPILSHALVQTQWVTPWFVRAEAEVDIMGWEVIIGKAGIFVGQNLEKKRIDFEGYIGAKVQIPPAVPVVGGMPLSSVFLGVNNDKVWGSVGILMISLGITYYWSGGIEFGTSLDELPDGLIHMVVEDPEKGPQLMVIGHGMETIATSWINAEKDLQEVTYRQVGDGVSVIDTGSMTIGMGGITVGNNGRVHQIPMNDVSGNALIEVEYDQAKLPTLTLTDSKGVNYPLIFDNTNTNPKANAFLQHIPANAEGNVEQVDIRKAYIIVPADRLNGGTWRLTSNVAVESKLLNVPTTPELEEVTLVNHQSNENAFKASWKVKNAKENDTVNLYLTKDSVSSTNFGTLENGEQVLETGEPGLLVAKDVPVTHNGSTQGTLSSGTIDIDVTKVDLLGDKEDIRSMLSQGDYYLRAELKSHAAFGTKTSSNTFKLVNPKAPGTVNNVEIKPAGNGYFALSFTPGQKKAGQDNLHYVIEAFQEEDGRLEAYQNYAEVMFTEEELEPYWNKQKKKYENIPVGGWTSMSTSETKVSVNSLQGTVMDVSEDSKNIHYVGLEVGKEYVVSVSSVNVEEVNGHQKFHFADKVNSNSGQKQLLPIPVKPKLLKGNNVNSFNEAKPSIELLTNQTNQSISLTSDQKNVEIEAFYGNQSIGKVMLTNNSNGGSSGTLKLEQFTTDGPYAIELIARNTVTKDISVTMLYLTVDTIAPILYLDKPITGTRTVDGKIQVSGTTTNDVSTILVNGSEVAVKQDGTFDDDVTVNSNEPTIDLKVIARDQAGNENSAVVVIANDQFEVPAGIVLKEIPLMKPGESTKLKAFLKLLVGKTRDNKPIFKEVPITEENKHKLKISISKGEAVFLSEDGTLLAVNEGASLMLAQYEVSEGVTIEAMAVASVKVPEPEKMETINAHTSVISNNGTKTKVTVNTAGHMSGYQFAYKLFAKGSSVNIPSFKEVINEWSILPGSGEILVNAGDMIVIAKRKSGSKEVVGVSTPLVAEVWTAPSPGPGPGPLPGPGPGPGPIPGPQPQPQPEDSPIKVDDQSVAAKLVNNVLVVKITKENLASSSNSKPIMISSSDKSVSHYQITLDKAVRKQAVSMKKDIHFNLPMAQFVFTPEMMAGKDEDITLEILQNDKSAISQLSSIANSVNGKLLGEGQGMTIKSNIFVNNSYHYLETTMPVPNSIDVGNITSVVLLGKDGSWTTLPGELEIRNGQTFINVKVTGEGNLGFIQNVTAFKDVPATHWANKAVSEAASKLYILGDGTGNFNPNSKVTRAQFPTILLRVAGFMNKNASANFTDVKKDDWYYRSVAIATTMGIVTGSNGKYSPNSSLTRLQGMVMVGRMLEVLGVVDDITNQEVEQILSSFKDGNKIPSWARKYTAITIKNGIIRGGNNEINPNGTLTRAQAAEIAVRTEKFFVNF
jgi:hypothetical protein